MATSSNATLHVPQFSRENYQIWTVKMKSYIKAFGLWDYVNEDKQVPPLRANPTIAQMKQHEEEKMKRDKAVTCLYSALSDSVFTSIMHLDTAKLICDELKKRFEGSERVRSVKLLTLKREFEMLRMKEGETVKDYSSKLSELVNQMRLYGDTIEDHKVVEKMLVSLPDKFEAKVAAIEEFCDLKALTVSEMVSKLQAQEQRLAIKNGDEMEGAFQAKHKGNQPFKKDKKKQGSGPRNGDKKGKAKLDSNSAEAGARNKAKPNQKTKQPTQQANFTDEQTPDDHLFMVTQVCNAASNEVWMTWVYFLANKAQTFDVFKKFKSMVEMESGCKFKVLRSDNGREYTSNRFNAFCEDMGIKHQLTVLYTPQQNRVSERKNRTVIEMARCLIAEKKLSKSFWAEAVHTSVYILNRLATKAVQGMTPLEAWTGLKRSVKHIKVFGSICYTHVADVKRTKLDEKAQLGIFIGYAVSSKGSLDDSKSTTRYNFSLGSGAFSWNSKKQEVVAQSTSEAEYVTTAASTNQAIWIRKVLANLNFIQAKPTVLWCDNISAISMAKNHVQNGRTKHINVNFHAIREVERDGEVKLVHCRTKEQVADILTKALGYGQFNVLRAKLGVSKKFFNEEC
ncbi:hypothetical protein EZV62_011029 [Acer yangbiense]|uniref:Integrase catalytic domain-containing protein n=1 Tax=Acer yangbiense TaxID=1000413 RepID=A0A5C7I4J5_9ROSI|nr:hypothetical protein EZV62_027849 [Acer yangbiense]TXG64035.1 hypothetical protein EZV62_011029 [Acer yangbiense]